MAKSQRDVAKDAYWRKVLKQFSASGLSVREFCKREQQASKQAAWIEENVPAGLTVFKLPASPCKRLRTANMMERLNRELNRRTRIATLFPNEASLLRLVTSLAMEQSEEWETGKRYVTVETK